MISVAVLLIVFILIAVRQIGSVKLQIWQIMLFGAVCVLVTGEISPESAVESVNTDVILFLFCVFVIGQALEESGYLSHLSYKLFARAKSTDMLVLFILFGAGAASAFLMNDTLAVIGTSVALFLARKHGMSSKLLLLALAFAVTIGSAASPIGNPQNLLISLNGGIQNPFVTFMKFLLLPTLINLFLAYMLLKLLYKKAFHKILLVHSREQINDRELAHLSRLSLILLITLVFVKVGVALLDIPIDFKLTSIALISALPVVLLSKKRFSVIRNIDWHTLIFFAAMFILMESVWESGFFQSLIAETNVNITSIFMILAISVLLSQLISNVPLVALYLPLLAQAGASMEEMMALAAGSTIAGNLFILGAASNVIIIQNAERKAGETLTFMEFAKAGIPLTIVNIIVYWIFFKLI